MQASIGVAVIVLVVIIIAFLVYRSRGCKTDADCNTPGLSQCSGGKCVAPAAPPAGCTTGDDCAAPNGCVSGTCAACSNASDCQTTGTTACNASGQCVAPSPAPSPAASCSKNTDCTTSSLTMCDTTSHQCVQCLSSGDCTDGDYTYCNANGICVVTPDSCNSTSDCTTSGLNQCNSSHQCVQCLSNGDCTSADAPNCNASGQCVGCSKNTDCPTDAPVCNTQSGTCVGCMSMLDCMAPSEFLLYGTGKGTLGSKACVDNACTSCHRNTDCDHGYSCYEYTGVCNLPCTANSDCYTNLCAGDGDYGYTCVSCGSDTDCAQSGGPGGNCKNGVCVACTGSDNCPEGQACVNGTCQASCTAAVDCWTTDQIASYKSLGYATTGLDACVSGVCGKCTGTGVGQCHDDQYCNTSQFCSNICEGNMFTGYSCLGNLKCVQSQGPIPVCV